MKPTRNSESGQAIIITTAGLVMLLGLMGLAIDMGVMRYEKRIQQTAADAGAIAGANNLTYGDVTSGARNAAAANGFSDTGTFCSSGCPASGSSGYITVTVNNPPAAPDPHSTDSKYVEVLVTEAQPTYFMKALGIATETITARAVATNVSGGSNSSGGGCVYTLGTPSKKLNAGSAGLGASGSVILNAPTCGILDNGNLVANGGKNLNITAGAIGVGGAYSPPSAGTVTPTPQTGMPYTGDPLAGQYTAPSVGSPTQTLTASPGVVTTFTPGTYTGGTINNNAEVVFSPGVYVVDGGTLQINGGAEVCGGGTVSNWSSATWSSTTTPACTYSGGVTFYLTNNATLTVNGTPGVQMYAPNSGSYEGLLIYQDPNDTNALSLSGNSSSFYQGAFYAPTADLNFGGNAGFNKMAAYTEIVTDQLTLNGNPDVNLQNDFSGLANGGGPLTNAISSAVLVE